MALEWCLVGEVTGILVGGGKALVLTLLRDGRVDGISDGLELADREEVLRSDDEAKVSSAIRPYMYHMHVTITSRIL